MRARSLVISGVPELQRDFRPTAKQADSESKITDLMNVFGVECRPLEMYRLGKPVESHPR